MVVRWYGGVKLGTGGLSRAYRETAAETLKNATLADRYLYETITVTAPFESVGVIYRLVNAPDIILRSESFGDATEFVIDVRRSRVDEVKATLTEKRLVMK